MQRRSCVLKALIRARAALGIVGVLVPLQATAQAPPCDANDPLHISIIFDNSVTVVRHESGLREPAREWLERILPALRPGDQIDVYGLAPRTGEPLPNLFSTRVHRGASDDSGGSEWARRITYRIFDDYPPALRTDLTRSLDAFATLPGQDRGECFHAVVLVSDGSLHPFYRNGMPPAADQAVQHFKDAARRLAVALGDGRAYAVSLGANSVPAIDDRYKLDLAEAGHAPRGAQARLNGEELLQAAFGRVYRESQAHELLYADTGSIFRTALGLQYSNTPDADGVSTLAIHNAFFEEPPGEAGSLCGTAGNSPSTGTVAAMVGSRCIVYARKASLVRERLARAVWVAFAPAHGYVLLPDTIRDLHQLGLSVEADTLVTCPANQLFTAVTTGTWPEYARARHVLHYQYLDGRDSTMRTLPLRRVGSSPCLFTDEFGKGDGASTGNHVRLTLTDPSTREVMLNAVRPVEPALFAVWHVEGSRTLASRILLGDRWLVSGTIAITAPAIASDTPRVRLGATSYLLNPDRLSTCDRLGDKDSPFSGTNFTCLNFTDLFVGDSLPTRALLALRGACEADAAGCHVATVAGFTGWLRLSGPAAAFWGVLGAALGIGLAFARTKPRPHWRKLLSWNAAYPLLHAGAVGALLVVAAAEVVMWTPQRGHVGDIVREYLVPLFFMYMLQRNGLPEAYRLLSGRSE